MYGALIGDIVGSPFEFNRGKSKEFEFYSMVSGYTDDTVMTIAIAEALMNLDKNASMKQIKTWCMVSMRLWGMKYPYSQYGKSFAKWLVSKKPKPYKSYGNGSGMRVSSVGWLYDDLKRVRKVARATASVTHNHKEGIKGAEAIASAIFLARTGSSKEEIKEYVVKNFQYDLSRTIDEIRPDYIHIETCQDTVPEAITAFLEGKDYEDVVRTAVSLGGDADTVACMAGSIAEAFYGIPEELKEGCRKFLKEDMLNVLDRFTMKMRTEGKESDN